MHMFKRGILAAFSAASIASSAVAATPWSESGLPVTGNVTVPSGKSIVLDTSLSLTSLTVNGEVLCGDRSINLSAEWIMVHGRFVCGTAEERYTKKLQIVLKGSNQGVNKMGMGAKFLGAMGGGEIELHGEARKSWTRLGETANRGRRSITLREDVDWREGDKIIITSTDYKFDHGEERTITAINGRSVVLDQPLERMHYCGTTSWQGKSITECAEVGLVTRNILIRGDASSERSGFGGHMMVMEGSSAKIDGVQFLHMGQKGKIARYPFHWHLTGDASGQYISNSSIVHSFNRFLSIHGTRNARVAGNFAYDTIGHGYYIEDGIETDNVIEDNVGGMVRRALDMKPTPSDATAAVFWISNPDNIVRRNVAAGSEHTGFWLGFPEHPVGLSATKRIWPRRTPLKEFTDNVSHSNNHRGLNVDGGEDSNRNPQPTWYEPREVPSDPTSPVVPPVFNNFTAYKNRFEGIWMRGLSRPVLRAPKLANNSMGAYFASAVGGTGTIEDGFVVGETGNKGNPLAWEKRGVDGRELPLSWEPAKSIRGLEFYDGPMIIKRTHFMNFMSNSRRKAGALTNLSPNQFTVDTGNAVTEASFKSANKVWLDPLTKMNSGDSFAVFRDLDGSVTGVKNRMIVPPNPVMYTSACTRMASWNAYVCPYSYAALRIRTDGSDINGSLLVRDDGKSREVGNPGGFTGQMYLNLITGKKHHLKMPIEAPKFLEFVCSGQPGKPMFLSIDYPTSKFTFKFWNYKTVQKVSSLSGLNSGGTKYFYDSRKKRLHLRLVSNDGTQKGYQLIRP